MTEQIKTTGRATPGSGPTSTPRAITHPREVAAVVMARMNQVNAKKDELGVSIHGLMEVMQQLTKIHDEQLLAIEQLRRRVKALETGTAGGQPSPPPVQ
ncbi:MAG TPA: hypothetical protein VF522_10890 [Ramlibacter sp.]|uniref:hypothetical protein n=1 Tax=Ramlibacter sp. TaxID=1917967 RepID=UPI002ED5A233